MSSSESSPTRVVYRIPNWDKQFEKARTREVAYARWISWSNRLDADWYCDILADQDGTLHLGTYLAICMAAATCEPRGTLLREDGEPHTAETLGLKTRIPVEVVRGALARLTSLRLIEQINMPVIEAGGPVLVNGAPAPRADPTKRRKESTALVPVDPEYEQWSQLWYAATKQRNHELPAQQAWLKFVAPLTDRTAFHECTANYLASDQVQRAGAITNRDRWITENAQDGWKSRWAPPKVEAQSAKGVVERTKRVGHARAAEGKPL